MRFRPRFSLRTLFVLVTISCLLMWWVRVNLKWIERRREFSAGDGNVVGWRVGEAPAAPWPLWLFGERGYSEAGIRVENQEAADKTRMKWPEQWDAQEQDPYLTDLQREKLAELKRLFPEAKVRANFFPLTPDASQ
jgi:hypothetical protein